jgi:transcriptional regulator with XRE-family HTH domain
MNISEKVREYRKEKAWSQEHLSSISGVCVKTIQRIEQGKGKASMMSQQALSSAFDIPLKELLHGKEKEKAVDYPKEYILEIYHKGECIEQRIDNQPTVSPLPGETMYLEFENSNVSKSEGYWWLVKRRRHLKFGPKSDLETLMLDCVPDPKGGA